MEKVERAAKAWIEPMARAGYASKGFVYFLIGILAVMAAFNLGGSIGGPEEALKTLQPKTFGQGAARDRGSGAMLLCDLAFCAIDL